MIEMNNIWIKLTAISGSAAVALGAIGVFLIVFFRYSLITSHAGAHAFMKKEDYFKDTWKTANYYHFMHTLALGLVSYHLVGNKRFIVGSLFVGGIILFSGSLYAIVLAGDKKPFAHIAPFGGIMFMLGWLALGFL
jgi:uncharacterized membrane protein YgdD (TMEM256/DUF423 family)